MNRTMMTTRLAAVLAVLAIGGPGAWAADAAHPYSNVDRSVDAGNDTGDSRTDQLNQQQLQNVGRDGGAMAGRQGQTSAGQYAYGAGPQSPYWGYPPPHAYPVPALAYAPYYGWRPWPWWGRRVWVGPRYYWR